MSPRNLFLSLFILVLAGCVSAPPQARLQIAGGERIMIDLRNGRVVGASYEDFKIRMGGLIPNSTEKMAFFTFFLEFKKGEIPRSIKVEDLTDQNPRVIVDEKQPKLLNTIWVWKSEPMKGDHADLSWLHELDDCFRVYRITVVMPDGRQAVQVQSYTYPAFIKAKFRKDLGIDQ